MLNKTFFLEKEKVYKTILMLLLKYVLGIIVSLNIKDCFYNFLLSSI